MPQPDHPLARLLLESALGRHPPVDGAVEVVPPWRDGVEAVVAFTGHAVVAGDVELGPLLAAGADGYGGAHHPAVLTLLAGTGEIGCLDAVLVGRGRGGSVSLVDRPDLADHPRVVHARHWRDDVRVLGDRTGSRGLVTLSRGLAGLTELSVEVTTPGRGVGGPLLDDALTAVPFGDPVWACVSPGNVASLRMFLAHGFSPVAGVVLVRPERPVMSR